MDLAAVASLIADPSRAAMLDALSGGEAFTAGELARLARIAPSTATEHLARLEDGGLVTSVRQGRARYVRLASGDVARALEALALIAPPKRANGLRAWQHGEDLRAARSCYDHLAGMTGVALADALVERRMLELATGLSRSPLRASASSPDSASTSTRCGAPAAPPRARAWTGPSGGRTSRARSARRCWSSCSIAAGCGAGTTAARCS